MKEKYVIVKGAAGLGNRLLTLTNAILYAKRTNRQIIVDWSEGQYARKGHNAFFECFELKNIANKKNLEEIKNPDELTIYPKAWKGHLEYFANQFKYNKSNLPLLSRLVGKYTCKGELAKALGYWDVDKMTGKNGVTVRSTATLQEKVSGLLSLSSFPHGQSFSERRGEDIVVYLDFEPNVAAKDFQQFIILQSHMSEAIEAISSKLNLHSNAVGIHVRYTDKMPTKNLETIVEKVKRLELNDPLIFLATDSTDVYNYLKKCFPEIISFAENLPKPPTEKKGIHHLFNDESSLELFKLSVMDMWLLSRCEYLFHQGNSSFSRISKFLHKDQHKVFDWHAD